VSGKYKFSFVLGFLSSGAGLLGVVDKMKTTEESESTAKDSFTGSKNRAVRFAISFG